MLELDPSQLGTLELDGNWVPYFDLIDKDFLPTHVKMANDEYAFIARSAGHADRFVRRGS